jgi:hypothetical protein
MHSRTIRIEHTDELDAEVMLAPVVEKERLSSSLALVVAGTQADRVDVAPIVLSLRVDLRIAVHLRSGGQQNPRLSPLGQAKHIDRPMHRSLGGLDWVALVVHRRRGAGQVVDLIDLDVKLKCHVVPDQLESRLLEQVLNVRLVEE